MDEENSEWPCCRCGSMNTDGDGRRPEQWVCHNCGGRWFIMECIVCPSCEYTAETRSFRVSPDDPCLCPTCGFVFNLAGDVTTEYCDDGDEGTGI